MRRADADAWTRLVGGLGRGRSAVVLTAAGGSALLVAGATTGRTGPARGALLGVVALDLVGGLIAFQMPLTRTHYAESDLRSRLTFAAVHLQPFVLPLTGEGRWSRAALRYATAVALTLAAESARVRQPSRRALAAWVGGGLALLDAATDRDRQRWLGPVYLVKVVGGHAGIPRVP